LLYLLYYQLLVLVALMFAAYAFFVVVVLILLDVWPCVFDCYFGSLFIINGCYCG
jgi:hypothetical protein